MPEGHSNSQQTAQIRWNQPESIGILVATTKVHVTATSPLLARESGPSFTKTKEAFSSTSIDVTHCM